MDSIIPNNNVVFCILNKQELEIIRSALMYLLDAKYKFIREISDINYRSENMRVISTTEIDKATDYLTKVEELLSDIKRIQL